MGSESWVVQAKGGYILTGCEICYRHRPFMVTWYIHHIYHIAVAGLETSAKTFFGFKVETL